MKPRFETDRKGFVISCHCPNFLSSAIWTPWDVSTCTDPDNLPFSCPKCELLLMTPTQYNTYKSTVIEHGVAIAKTQLRHIFEE